MATQSTWLSRVLLHAGAAAIMAWGFDQLKYTPMDAWIRGQVGGHWQFLTIQGLALAWITMLFSLASDLAPHVHTFRQMKRTLMMIALPLAFVISTIYWSLLLVKPEMILRPIQNAEDSVTPDELVPSSTRNVPSLQRIPLSMDLALHAAPALSMLLDFSFFEKRYGRFAAVYGATIVCAIATLVYANWVEYCATFNGSFPYPFLTENPPNVRKAIYAGAGSFALVTFWLVNSLHP